MHLVKLDKWRGRRDEQELEPEAMQFTERAAVSKCRGCLFDGQWSRVCMKAAATAVRANLNDCDAGYIYVAVQQDPRQMALVR